MYANQTASITESTLFRNHDESATLRAIFQRVLQAMKVASVNVNGLRSAARKGFINWLQSSSIDICCLQEIRIQESQLDETLRPGPEWTCLWFPAERPGYSGTALWTRIKPDSHVLGLGFSLCDQEGRWIQAHFGALTVVSLYLPSGSASEQAQERKNIFLESLTPILAGRHNQDSRWILCGDFNIAHKEIDLRNWRGNQKNSGFLPHERAWMDHLFGPLGMLDAFRVVDPRPDQYTWWSQRGRAYDNNVGWRIDYQVVSSSLKSRIRSAEIYKQQKFSDHAPLIMEYDL